MKFSSRTFPGRQCTVLQWLFIVCVWPTAFGYAQVASTGIVGTVTDASGAVVAGAKVILFRPATAVRQETTTTSTGDYIFPAISVGQYTVSVEMAGFSKQERSDITVEYQQEARVDFQLSVGNVATIVHVTGVPPLLNTEEPTVGQVVDNKQILDLPVNGRTFAALAMLNAGVFYGYRMGLGGTSTNSTPIPGHTSAIAANGQAESREGASLDGVTVIDTLQSTIFFTPSLDALDEFKVMTSNASAEYGESSGAYTQMVFKSGTNQLHGTAFEFNRNGALAADDYFLNFQVPAGTTLLPKQILRRNQFGGFLGGPVLIPKVYDGRNRTFWSFDYEGERQTSETPTQGFFYPAAFRNGDFSALLTPPIGSNGKPIRAPVAIYNPATGQQYPGNVISTGIMTNAQGFLSTYMPPPNYSPSDPLANNYNANVDNIVYDNQYILRIDHEIRSKDRIMGHLVADRAHNTIGALDPNFPDKVATQPTNVAVQFIHVFSPSILNEFLFGYNYENWAYLNPHTGTSFNPDSLGFGTFNVVSPTTGGGTTSRALTALETGIPNISLVGGCCSDPTGGDYNRDYTHQFIDNVQIVHGSHNMKMGFEYRLAAVNIASGNNTRGSMSFGLGNYSLVGFLLGYPSSDATPGGTPLAEPRQNRYGLYFQDDWKATRKLTVNLGARWDYWPSPYDAIGNWRTLRLTTLTTATTGQLLPTLLPNPGTANYDFTQGDSRPLIQPRVGLAYRVTDKWVVRTGMGWYTNPHYLNNFQIGARQPPLAGTYGYSAVTTTSAGSPVIYDGTSYAQQVQVFASGSPILSFANAFPGAGSSTLGSRAGLSALPLKDHYTDVWEWNFDLQRELPGQMTLTVGYVGNKSTHVDYSEYNYDQGDPCMINVCPNALATSMPYESYVDSWLGNTPQGLASIRYEDFSGNGHYEALQVSLRKHYNKGLDAGLSYTWGKGLSDAYDRNTTPFAYQDPRNRKAEMQPMPFDLTQNLSANFVYGMPFLNRFKGVTGGFLAGWQVNGIISMHTGFADTVGGGNLNVGITGYSRPDLIGNPKLSNPTRQDWYNISAFGRTDCTIIAEPGWCHYGDAGPGIIRGPGLHTFDLSLFKNWTLGKSDTKKLQLRGEFFNAFNTPQFGLPNGLAWASPTSYIADAANVGNITTDIVPMRTIQLGLKLYF